MTVTLTTRVALSAGRCGHSILAGRQRLSLGDAGREQQRPGLGILRGHRVSHNEVAGSGHGRVRRVHGQLNDVAGCGLRRRHQVPTERGCLRDRGLEDVGALETADGQSDLLLVGLRRARRAARELAGRIGRGGEENGGYFITRDARNGLT